MLLVLNSQLKLLRISDFKILKTDYKVDKEIKK